MALSWVKILREPFLVLPNNISGTITAVSIVTRVKPRVSKETRIND